MGKTSLSNRIAGLQTLATEEGKQMVLSVTLSDGNNVKYLIKLPQADKLQAAVKEAPFNEKVSSWEIERLGTAVRRQSIAAWRCAEDFATNRTEIDARFPRA